MNEELMIQAKELQEQSEEAEKNLKVVKEQINELEQFIQQLDSISKSDEKEALALIGKGVYVKAKIDPEQKLFVNVGGGVVLQKNISEIKEIIKEQISKFQAAKVHFLSELEDYAQEFKVMVNEIEKLKEEGRLDS